MKKYNTPHVYLDTTNIDPIKLEQEFPTIKSTCMKLGINISKTFIPVLPAAHYFCGGIDVDENGQSSLSALYAIGECSHTGLHGANRLASNSLLEALVFAARAAEQAAETLQENILPLTFFDTIPELFHLSGWRHSN